MPSSVHMKMQTQAVKRCQVHAKATGGDITSAIRPGSASQKPVVINGKDNNTKGASQGRIICVDWHWGGVDPQCHT